MPSLIPRILTVEQMFGPLQIVSQSCVCGSVCVREGGKIDE